MKPLISIIVPFYNIEQCVKYCMDSLLRQTVGDYEIVCVDDGSSDNTGKILDSYENDAKVSVYHKQNGGLSDARNYGVRHSRGRLITFVDGDDIVSPDYLQTLMKCCNSDTPNTMVIGSILYVSDSEAVSGRLQWDSNNANHLMEKREVILKYMYEEILPGACCRLAPRTIYEKRPFPTGVVYEEIATAAKYVTDVDRITISDKPIYGYVMRSGSIVHRKEASFKQVEDYVSAIKAFEDAIEDIVRLDDKARVYFKCLHYSRLFRLLDVVVDAGDEPQVLQREIVKIIRANLGILLSDKRISKGNKVRFIILTSLPGIYTKIFDAYDRRRMKALTKRRGDGLSDQKTR